MIDLTNLTDALPIIMRDDSVFEELKADFPDILADLVTFKSNPNCTCRGKVFKFFSDKLSQNPTLLHKYVKNLEALSKELELIKNQRMANNYSGRIITLDKSEKAWEDFSKSLMGKMFRSFSVVEKEDNITVYFL